MFRSRGALKWGALSLATFCLALGLSNRAVTQQPDGNQPDAQEGVEALAQGPIHEAFGEPVNFDPAPGIVISQKPPEPVAELPPDQKPEGDNVDWIPGYWGYDHSNKGLVWVSGFWRALPPGMRWVPGYWHQVEEGYEWVSGFWAPVDQPDVTYLPPPPESLESGPSTQAPGDNQVWVPGCWIWRDTRYLWRPGYWIEGQENWVWVPDHYVWAPAGCVFVAGYWDYPLQDRGLLFAPVAFQQPLYTQPNYYYTPSAVVNLAALSSSLFAWPNYNHYYFGNYYGNNYLQRGIYPWFAFHNSRYGYDPVFAHMLWSNERRDPQWLNRVREEYHARVANPQARPPRTFAAEQALFRQGGGGRAGSLALVQSLSQVATAAGTRQGSIPLRLQQIDRQQRSQIAHQAAAVRQAGVQRVRLEREAEAKGPLHQAKQEARPVRLNVPATHLASRPVQQLPQRHVPPALPKAAREVPTTHEPPARPAARPHPEQLLKAPPQTARPQPTRPETAPRETVRPQPTRPEVNRPQPPREPARPEPPRAQPRETIQQAPPREPARQEPPRTPPHEPLHPASPPRVPHEAVNPLRLPQPPAHSPAPQAHTPPAHVEPPHQTPAPHVAPPHQAPGPRPAVSQPPRPAHVEPPHQTPSAQKHP